METLFKSVDKKGKARQAINRKDEIKEMKISIEERSERKRGKIGRRAFFGKFGTMIKSGGGDGVGGGV